LAADPGTRIPNSLLALCSELNQFRPQLFLRQGFLRSAAYPGQWEVRPAVVNDGLVAEIGRVVLRARTVRAHLSSLGKYSRGVALSVASHNCRRISS
jgi:hypothetical protein